MEKEDILKVLGELIKEANENEYDQTDFRAHVIDSMVQKILKQVRAQNIKLIRIATINGKEV